MTAVIFFLISSSLIVLAVSETVARTLYIGTDLIRSKESFFAADSGGEDVVYRLKNGRSVSSAESITVLNQTATTTVADVLGGKEIQSVGVSAGRVRKSKTKLSQGGGSAFFYGVQVGKGGVRMYNSSSIAGNVFSDGPVVGDGNVNTGDVTKPDLKGSVTVGGGLKTAQDLAVSGSYAYVLTNTTFDVVSISNPTSPSIIKSVTTQYSSSPYQNSIYFYNDHLYITHEAQNYLDIYNVSNPANPILMPHVALPGYSTDVLATKGYAYVVNYANNNLVVINVSNPAQASVVKTVPTVLQPKYVTLSGQYLYVAANQGGGAGTIQIFDISNPADPVPRGKVEGNGIGPSVLPAAISGSYAYLLTESLNGLYTISISSPSNPTLVSQTAQGAIYQPMSIDTAAGYLYIANYSPSASRRELEVWSLTNPASPVKVNSVSVSSSAGNPKTVVAKNGHVYLLNSVPNSQSKLQIYNISGGTGGNLVKGDVISAGPSGSVSLIHATSSVYARTIANSVIDKDAYYQTISNTSVGGNSYAGSTDQATSSMPIADSVILGWETDAASGGTVNTPCPYQITSDTTIGPKKINCDLEITGNITVNLVGPVWVVGNVKIKNNAIVKVSPNLAGRTLQIIADNPADRLDSSKINLDNSASFLGSGTNSYVMLVSMNKSSEATGRQGNLAIETNNSAGGALVLYAPHGEILLTNAVVLKEVTAHKLTLKNSAQVIYESGLQNILFTSGPGGSYTFSGWGEK